MAEFDSQASCLVTCDHAILIKLKQRGVAGGGPSCNEKMVCVRVKSLQSCLTPYDSMDCSPPGSSVHRILQARILEWVAMPSSRGPS